jgi:ApbE superfamily uncharacterized protein (UPF0280 family)
MASEGRPGGRLVPLRRKKQQSFTLQIQDFVLRVNAPEEFYEESRAAALSMWEQVQSYSVRDQAFRTSKRPVQVPDSAPAVVREMAEAAASAGVGPVFTVQGALVDHVGRYLSRNLHEVLVSAGGDHFIRSRKRLKLPVHHGADGEGLSVIVDPARGVAGVSTTLGKGVLPAESVDGLAVVAESCCLADAAAAAAMAILARNGSFQAALAYLRRIEGVRGAVLIQGERIGVSGGVEVAA